MGNNQDVKTLSATCYEAPLPLEETLVVSSTSLASQKTASTLNRKPRVLFVNTRSAIGADVAVHLTLIQNFSSEQVEVFVATNRNAVDRDMLLSAVGNLSPKHLKVYDLGYELSGAGQAKFSKLWSGLKNLGALVSLLRLAWFVRTHGIDILHTTDRPRDALFTGILAKLTGRKSILHVHIKWYTEIGRATHYGVKASAGILAISQFVRGSLMAGGIPEARIYTAHNAISPNKFDPEKVQKGFLRDHFGLSEKTPLIGIVGRIMVWKGHRELIEALAKVKEVVPGVRLAIIGTEDLLATDNTESYLEGVKRRIAELGLEENVLWMGWSDAIPKVMADLDVLAVPSWEEPFGLVVTEGMAMQRPIVGFRSGALPEIVNEGEEGFLVPQRDTQALAAALITLLRDPVLRTEMGRKGRERVLNNFTPAHQCATVTEIYRRVLANLPDKTPLP